MLFDEFNMFELCVLPMKFGIMICRIPYVFLVKNHCLSLNFLLNNPLFSPKIGCFLTKINSMIFTIQF